MAQSERIRMRREAEALTYFEAQQRGSVRLIRILSQARDLFPLQGIGTSTSKRDRGCSRSSGIC